MTILPSDAEFPNNVISVMATRIPQYIDPDVRTFKRSLKTSDPSQVVGLFPSLKVPNEQSWEIGGGADSRGESTIKRYTVIAQSYVKDTKEENAISVHSILANRLWRMWHWDYPLHVGLTALQVVANNTTERFQRRGATSTRYLSNEIQGSFLQTSWIEFWFETETVRNA